jgi:hypothetical protein
MRELPVFGPALTMPLRFSAGTQAGKLAVAEILPDVLVRDGILAEERK